MQKWPPTPLDPAVETALPAGLRAALDEYAALERGANAVASGSCASVCAACRNPCCRAAFCRESWEAPWLRLLSSRPGARRDPPPSERALEGHLATDGCRLRFGRPPICYEFACHDVMGRHASDDEKYLYRVLSHVVSFAGDEAIPGTHLVEVADLGQLGRAETRRLRARIALAGKIFDAAGRLFEARGRGLASDWSLVTRYFPTKGYKLTCGARAPLRLPMLRAGLTVLVVALAGALAILGTACRGSGKRLYLDRPAEAAPAAAPAKRAHAPPDEYRDGSARFTFDAYTDGIRVVIQNASKTDPLTVAWDRARYVDPAGLKHEVVGYIQPRAAVLRQETMPPLTIAPGASWSGRIHPRYRCQETTGPRFHEAALLTPEEEMPGTPVGLELQVETGGQARTLKFRFVLAAPEAHE